MIMTLQPAVAAEPLVLLPGMGCSPALWSLLDLGGQVLQPRLGEVDLDQQVDRLLDELPQRFVLGGLSLGAIIAMALVRRAPERVTQLVLLSTNPYGPTDGQRAGWLAQRELLAADGPRALQESLLAKLLSPSMIVDRPDLVELTLAMADEVGAADYDSQIRLQGTRIDERPGLTKINFPTLVIAAADDQLCPVERHREIADLIPGARLEIIPNAAHLSTLEQPAMISRLLRDFLTP